MLGGKLHGNGTLKVHENAPAQLRCIKVYDFKLDTDRHGSPDFIKGSFQEGFLIGPVELKWTKYDITLEGLAHYGVIHSLYKAFDGNSGKSMIGHARKNALADDENCWMSFPDNEVIKCFGVFKLDKYSIFRCNTLNIFPATTI